MNRKPSRGIVGYVVLLSTLLLIAILLNGGLNQTVNRRIEYPKLLEMIKNGEVGRVAIRNNSLVLVKNAPCGKRRILFISTCYMPCS